MNTTRKAAALLSSAAAAVLASAAPSSAAAAPVKAAVAVPATCFPAYYYQFTGNGVNIHQRPFTVSAGGAILGLGYRGQQFVSRQHTVINEGYTWVYGTDQSTGVTGWAVTAYLKYLGDYGTCL